MSDPPTALTDTIRDRYVVEREIGEGGMVAHFGIARAIFPGVARQRRSDPEELGSRSGVIARQSSRQRLEIGETPDARPPTGGG